MHKITSEEFMAFITLLLETSQLAIRHGDIVCQKFGQSSARWRVMLYVTKGYDTVSAIAKATAISRQGTQRLTDELVADGLIAYSIHNDRRTKTVKLTDRGQMVVDEMEQVFALNADRISAKIERSTIEEAMRVLELIKNVIDDDLTKIVKG